MARVIASEVKQILETSLSDSDVDAFINAANLVVTARLGTNTTLSDNQRKEIERFLAAHMIACTKDQQASQEQVGDQSSITYQGKTGFDLDSTFYGQQVKLLDITGTLASKSGKKAATVHAITSFS